MITLSLRALWFGCWFSHDETIRVGISLECQRCGATIPVLPQARVIGPAHVQQEARGKPIYQVTRTKVRPGNVTEFPRQSER